MNRKILFFKISHDLIAALDRKANKKYNSITDNLKGNSFLFLGYFSVHSTKFSEVNHCGKILKEGVVFVEAMRYALRKVNEGGQSLLFGMKAYFRIVDTCRNVATLSRAFRTDLQYYYMGIVGPTTSDQATLTSVVHGAFDAAVVSPSAASEIFDDRAAYYNFFRTVPSDVVQIDVLIELVSYFNWTYVSTVNSYGEYGQRGIERFREIFKSNGGCIARQSILPMRPEENDYVKAINELASTTEAKVVIMFTLLEDTNNLLKHAKKLGFEKVTWVSSTSWLTGAVIADEAAKGAFVLRYKSVLDKSFENYFMNLTLKTNEYTWFGEFWSEVFNCSYKDMNDRRPACRGNESLHDTSFKVEGTSVQPVLNAVESILCALRMSIKYRCPSQNISCISGVKLFTYSFEKDVVQYLRAGSTYCHEFKNSVRMNQDGYYEKSIEIMNFDGKDYNKVGEWTMDSLTNKSYIQWTNLTGIVWNQNKSFCSLPCKANQVKLINMDGCCYTCKSCMKDDIVVNNTCSKCFHYEVPDKNWRSCLKLPKRYMFNAKLPSIVSAIFSLIGVITNTGIIAVFIKNRRTRIVKARSFELTAIIFVALYICFITPLTFLIKPSLLVCGLQRLIVGISLTSSYTPLLLKTIRIYRIFSAAQSTVKKPLLVSSKSQILICLSSIGLQLLLGIMWVITDEPVVAYVKQPMRDSVAVLCHSKTVQVIFNLIPPLLLMGACTVFAYKTRHFPSNFNEALSIFTAMYISCFIWGIFITVIVFLEMDTGKIFELWFIIANFTAVIGFVTLISLFGPMMKKLYGKIDVDPNREIFSNALGRPVTNQEPIRMQMSVLGVVTEDPENCLSHRKNVITKDASTNTFPA